MKPTVHHKTRQALLPNMLRRVNADVLAAGGWDIDRESLVAGILALAVGAFIFDRLRDTFAEGV